MNLARTSRDGSDRPGITAWSRERRQTKASELIAAAGVELDTDRLLEGFKGHMVGRFGPCRYEHDARGWGAVSYLTDDEFTAALKALQETQN